MGISIAGLSLEKSRINDFAPNAKVSKSYEITPSAKLFFVNQAHWASAYPYDRTVGIPFVKKHLPIKLSIVIVSWIYSLEILTLLLLCLAASIKSPKSKASYDLV